MSKEGGMLWNRIRTVWVSLLFGATLATVALFGAQSNQDSVYFFWKAVKEQRTIHILGSIHVGNPELYPLSSVVEQAFASSEGLLVEIDLQNAGNAAVLKAVQNKMYYGADSALSMDLSDTSYKALQSLLKEWEVPIAVFEKTRPWAVSLMLTMEGFKRAGLQPEHGIDKYFMDQAYQSQKPVHGLETMEFQTDMLMRLSQMYGDALLLYTIADLAMIQEYSTQILQSWKSGNDAQLQALILETYSKKQEMYGDFLDILIYDRNHTMVDSMVQMSTPYRSVFVVVGAAHLLGQQGIPSLLEQKGYVVHRIR
jgi:uncharacterized protein